MSAERSTPLNLFACALDGDIKSQFEGQEQPVTTDFYLCEPNVDREIQLDGIYAYMFFEPGHPYQVALEHRAKSHLKGAHYDANDIQIFKDFFIKVLRERPSIDELTISLDALMRVEDSLAFYKRPLDKRVDKVMELIKQRPQLNHAVEDLAEAVFLSPSRLMGLFKQQTGITLGNYMASLKCINAYVLYFKKGRLKDAALRAGFYDEAHFSKTSKKLIGFLPSAFVSNGVHTELITNIKV